jgi:hypothetical protein
MRSGRRAGLRSRRRRHSAPRLGRHRAAPALPPTDVVGRAKQIFRRDVGPLLPAIRLEGAQRTKTNVDSKRCSGIRDPGASPQLITGRRRVVASVGTRKSAIPFLMKKALATEGVRDDIAAVRHDLPHMPSLGVSSLDSRPPWRHGGLLFLPLPVLGRVDPDSRRIPGKTAKDYANGLGSAELEALPFRLADWSLRNAPAPQFRSGWLGRITPRPITQGGASRSRKRIFSARA